MELIVKILPWAQIILSVLLVAAIIMQRGGSEAGGALGSSSDGGFGAVYHTKRGLEKILFNTTILIAILFAVSAFIALIIK